MAQHHYKVVPHDGGYAYTFEGVFSEPFPTREAALKAARRVVAEQHLSGDDTMIEYQDGSGAWHTETSKANDRPDVDVEE